MLSNRKGLNINSLIMLMILLFIILMTCSKAEALVAIDRVVLTPEAEGGVTVTFRVSGRHADGSVEYSQNNETKVQKALPTYNEKRDYTVFKAHLVDVLQDLSCDYRPIAGHAEGSWHTFDAISGDKPFTFIFMGDSQEDLDSMSGYEDWGNMLRQAANGAELLLLGGDLINEGSDEGEWDRFFAGSGETLAEIRVAPAVGNHDNTKLFKSIFSVDSFYSFDLGGVHFVVMDSNLMGGAEEQYIEWLQNDLKKAGSAWKIVMFHHPVYKAVEMTKDDWRSDIYMEKWVPIFEKWGVDVVLNGHQHVYMRTCPMSGGEKADSGITYIMGVSNSKSYDVADFDYMAASYGGGPVYTTFSVCEKNIEATTTDDKGNIIDSFEIKREGAKAYSVLSKMMTMWYDLMVHALTNSR